MFSRRCKPARDAIIPAIVTTDAYGNSLHADVERETANVLATL